MKEVRFFYVPEACDCKELPEEEAAHAVRVLRLSEGDEIVLIDGVGNFHDAVITEASKKHCMYEITRTRPQQKGWNGYLHLAMAPTKNMDRTEWTCEKATEIGFDHLTFLKCKFSERTTIKTERIDKILVSAMKQSHKAVKPVLDEMVTFKDFIDKTENRTNKFICHCYDEPDLGEKELLLKAIKPAENTIVMVGPEGDFSIDEIKYAEAHGFKSVSLGTARLRTETAALVTVHIMNLINSGALA